LRSIASGALSRMIEAFDPFSVDLSPYSSVLRRCWTAPQRRRMALPAIVFSREQSPLMIQQWRMNCKRRPGHI
jgi:hypothetical protein